MATTVYVPRDERAGELGTGIGAALGTVFRVKEEQAQQQRQNEFLNAIRTSGSRERAMEVVANYSTRLKHPTDFNFAFKAVDEMWPAPSKTPHELKVYDTTSGAETTAFVSSGQTPELNDPEVVKRLFGPNASLTKPDLEHFYQPGEKPGDFKYLGRKPVDQRPEGAMTLKEVEQQQKARTEDLANQRLQASQDEAAARQRRFEERMQATQDHWAATLSKMGEPASDRTLNRGRMMLNDAARMSATSLNARVLPDGSFGFEDENKSKLWTQRTDYMSNLVEQDPSILTKPNAAMILHNAATKAFPSVMENPPPLPTPTPKKGGVLSRMFGSNEGGAATGTGEKKPKDEAKALAKEGGSLEAKGGYTGKAAVEKAGWKYQPDVYEYRVGPSGTLQRRKK